MSQPTSGDSPTTSMPGAGDTAAATPTLLLVESDLFFVVKVRDTLAAAGYRVRVARRPDEVPHLLEDDPPALVLVNAGARGIDWRPVVDAARERTIPTIVYAPHVDLDTQAAARAAGATRVIANSKLGTDLPGLVARTLRPHAGQSGTGVAMSDPDPHSTGAFDGENEIAAISATPDSPLTVSGKGLGERSVTESKNESAAISAITSGSPPTLGGGRASLDRGEESGESRTERPQSKAEGLGERSVTDTPAVIQPAPITPSTGSANGGAPEQRGSRREAMDT